MIPLPDLPSAYDALEPVLSDAAMRLRHDPHHGRYVDAVNDLTAPDRHHPASLEEIIRHATLAGERKLFNNAAQAWNHAFLWRCMTPRQAPPRGALAHAGPALDCKHRLTTYMSCAGPAKCKGVRHEWSGDCSAAATSG